MPQDRVEQGGEVEEGDGAQVSPAAPVEQDGGAQERESLEKRLQEAEALAEESRRAAEDMEAVVAGLNGEKVRQWMDGWMDGWID